MKEVIEIYRSVVLQIATPYCTGTGFYLKEPNLIVTNEHVVRDNREVVIDGQGFGKQLVKVIFLDPKYDLAFLAPPSDVDLPAVRLAEQDSLSAGDRVYFFSIEE